MTVPTNAYQTYQAIGRREDLTDLITNISPTDTPILSMTERTTASGILHEWQTDSLKSPALVSEIEGDDANYKLVTPSARVSNSCQIIDNAFIVSQTQEAVKSAGRASETEYQTAKAMKELANDIEFSLVLNTAVASGTSANARQLKGIRGWLATNNNTATYTRTFTSTLVDGVLKAAWLLGGKPDTILLGGTLKIAMTNTTNFPGMTKNVQAADGIYKNFIDVYQGGIGGQLKVVTSTIMGNNADSELYALELAKWRPAFLRPINRVELARTGDGRKFQIVAELTLESLQEKASAKLGNVA